MSTITILGLGPGDAALLTRAAWELLQTTELLYLRTAVHPTVAALPPRIELRPFDALYEAAEDFGALYDRIAADLVERAQRGEEVIYAVPGHPLVAEATTRRLLALARERGVRTYIIPGLSFIEPVCTSLELDPLEQGMQLLDALDLVLADQRPTTNDQRQGDKETRRQGDKETQQSLIHALSEANGSNLQSPDSLETQNSKLKTQNSELRTTDGAWSEVQGIGPYTPVLLPFPLVPTRPALICQLYSRHIASHVKLSLMERYPAEHVVTLVHAAGVAGQERVWRVPLHELDHQPDLDHLTCAYLPPLAPLDDLRGPAGIGYVVTRLLGPRGCPWDREQTHRSLRSELLEEAHEVLEAIDADDMGALAEELGDLMLNILMHSEMARQAGDFDIGEVYQQIAAKLIRRHPHVFGATHVAGSSDVLRNWEAIKQAERAQQGRPQRGSLDGIPAGLPSLATAQELTHKAAKAAFDWPDLRSIWDKLDEELLELREAVQASGEGDERTSRIEDELGDLLFAASNLARWLHVDAESALRASCAKFRRRFAYVEQQAQQQGGMKMLDIAALLALWEEAKQKIEDRK